jgi:hypothetical protein
MPQLDFALDTRLAIAALILAVRTARCEDREFQGMSSPRVRAALSASLWLSDELLKLAAAEATKKQA